MLLEIACFSIQAAFIAQEAGADRIELCDDYPSGGVTPSRESIIQARTQIKLPLHVMIHPRKGPYRYDAAELDIIENTIIFCKKNGINGVVTGLLNEDNTVDTVHLKELVQLAQPMKVVFHRAFDLCDDPFAAAEELVRSGVDSVLTSGGPGNAIENRGELKKLNDYFKGRLNIVAGGGIRSTNISGILQTGCTQYHSAAITDSSFLPAAGEIRLLKKALNGQQNIN